MVPGRGLRDVGRGAAGQLWKVVPFASRSKGPACWASIITAGKGQTNKGERQRDRENEGRYTGIDSKTECCSPEYNALRAKVT